MYGSDCGGFITGVSPLAGARLCASHLGFFQGSLGRRQACPFYGCCCGLGLGGSEGKGSRSCDGWCGCALGSVSAAVAQVTCEWGLMVCIHRQHRCGSHRRLLAGDQQGSCETRIRRFGHARGHIRGHIALHIYKHTHTRTNAPVLHDNVLKPRDNLDDPRSIPFRSNEEQTAASWSKDSIRWPVETQIDHGTRSRIVPHA